MARIKKTTTTSKTQLDDLTVKLTESLNKILINLGSPHSNSLLKFIKKVDEDTPIRPDEDGRMGEENTFYQIFQVVGTEFYLRINYYTDSYGNGDYVRGVQIVQPKEKLVTVFE